MSELTAIFANPGQQVVLPIDTTDGYGSRVDGYQPTIESILLPNSTFAAGYPVVMTRVDTGFYISKLTIPSGIAGLGSYVVSVLYDDPANPAGHEIWKMFLINVAMPFGNSSVSPR